MDIGFDDGRALQIDQLAQGIRKRPEVPARHAIPEEIVTCPIILCPVHHDGHGMSPVQQAQSETADKSLSSTQPHRIAGVYPAKESDVHEMPSLFADDQVRF
jgi:hypothetical protein